MFNGMPQTVHKPFRRAGYLKLTDQGQTHADAHSTSGKGSKQAIKNPEAKRDSYREEGVANYPWGSPYTPTC